MNSEAIIQNGENPCKKYESNSCPHDHFMLACEDSGGEEKGQNSHKFTAARISAQSLIFKRKANI